MNKEDSISLDCLRDGLSITNEIDRFLLTNRNELSNVREMVRALETDNISLQQNYNVSSLKVTELKKTVHSKEKKISSLNEEVSTLSKLFKAENEKVLNLERKNDSLIVSYGTIKKDLEVLKEKFNSKLSEVEVLRAYCKKAEKLGEEIKKGTTKTTPLNTTHPSPPPKIQVPLPPPNPTYTYQEDISSSPTMPTNLVLPPPPPPPPPRIIVKTETKNRKKRKRSEITSNSDENTRPSKKRKISRKFEKRFTIEGWCSNRRKEKFTDSIESSEEMPVCETCKGKLTGNILICRGKFDKEKSVCQSFVHDLKDCFDRDLARFEDAFICRCCTSDFEEMERKKKSRYTNRRTVV